MGERTRAKIGTAEGVKTVRVYSANPKTVDGYNTFIFRRDIARSLSKLAWAPVIDGSRNPVLEGVELGDRSVRYSADDKRRLIEFVERIADAQKGSIENDDFGHFDITKIFATEVQCHAISTRREIESVSSAAEIARSLIHFVGSPNEEQKRKKPNKYFEYGLAKIRLSDGVYLVMGEVGIRVNKRPYYDQRVVAKFKADSEVSSLHGQTQIGESAFEQVYDNRFRLILQGVELYYKQSPKFSIIIPVYNVEPYLRECLDSVLAQTFTNWEAICVDDGSTDGSGNIMDEYAVKDIRFKVIHQKNSGVSAARNAALKVAAGEWVTFLDADDRIESERLVALFTVADGHDGVDWIRETKYAAKEDKYMIENQCNIVVKDIFLAGWELLKQNALLWLNTYRRSRIANIKFPVGVRYAEDDIFELRCLPHCKAVAVVGYCGYWYRIDRIDAASRRIDVEDSVKIHKLLLETAESQQGIIDKIEDRKRFVALFSRTVRKDFWRVFRQFRHAPRSVQEEHRAISSRIYESSYFSAWHVEKCRVGYWMYMRMGWLWPLLIQDLMVRILSKINRCILHRNAVGGK